VRRVEALESALSVLRGHSAAEAQAERERALNPPPAQIPPEDRQVVGWRGLCPEPAPAAELRPTQAELLKAAEDAEIAALFAPLSSRDPESAQKPPEVPTLKMGDILAKIDPQGRVRFSVEFATEALGIAPDAIAGQSKLYTATSARCMLHELAARLGSIADLWEF
jgi:hypothetical protein